MGNSLKKAIEYAKEQAKIAKQKDLLRVGLEKQTQRKLEEERLEKARENIRQQIISDGSEELFDLDDTILLDAIIANPKFYVLKKNTYFIDLHGYYLDEALDTVKKNSFEVIQGNGLQCCGFIHGKGMHSTNDYLLDGFIDIDDFYDIEELYDEEGLTPTLKPLIRKYLDILAEKNNCKNIYGETLFKTDSSWTNSGITYFMNMEFYNYFNESGIKWNGEKIWSFQEFNKYKIESDDDYYYDDLY